MKFDADKVLLNRDGAPVQEPAVGLDGKIIWENPDEPDVELRVPKMRSLTHGIVAVRAIDATVDDDDKKLSADIVRKRFTLGARLMAGGIVELSKEEVALIEDRVCVFGVMIAGPVLAVLGE